MEHTLGHPLGFTHLVVAIAALVAGTLVVLTTKGSARHVLAGRAYLLAMLAVNASAFMIYELYSGFGLFHWAAVFSLATVLAGYLSARQRRPGWKIRHAYFMSGSYVGLIAALAAELLTRTPWLPFLWAVGLASAAVFAIGLYVMFRVVPRLVGRPPPLA